VSQEDSFEIDPAAESFYSGALLRISRVMLVLAVLLTISTWAYFGYQKGLGLAAGAAIAYLNFVWLKRAVVAMADRIAGAGERRRGGAVVAKFLLRYLLAGMVAFLLYRFVPGAMAGFLAGLFLPVAAILCEAAFEAYIAVARGT
jgi:hypothetical protein